MREDENTTFCFLSAQLRSLRCSTLHLIRLSQGLRLAHAVSTAVFMGRKTGRWRIQQFADQTGAQRHREHVLVLAAHQPLCRHSGPGDRDSSIRPAWDHSQCCKQLLMPAWLRISMALKLQPRKAAGRKPQLNCSLNYTQVLELSVCSELPPQLSRQERGAGQDGERLQQ